MTSPLAPDLAARVAKILPRLASDQNGEVAATAAAISRTLQAAGRDFHDLAAHLTEGPRTVVVYRERPAPREPRPFTSAGWRAAGHAGVNAAHRDVVGRCKWLGEGRLNEWEAAFLVSLSQQLAKGRSLTAKQASALEGIAAKLKVTL